ncbi:hypothetical protein AgCh_011151 [Apium graveolens]
MAEDGKVKIDKFDGKDDGFWKMKIEDYLYQKKLHEPLEEKKPTAMKDEDRKLLDRQALGVVRLTLAKNVAYNIVRETTTYDLIKALSNMYEKSSASNKVYLIRLLVATRLNEGDCVVDHVNEFNSILARLASVDIKFDDKVQALMLASSLPDSWSGFVTAISNSSGSGKMTFDGVRDSILGEDIRRRKSGESSGSLLSAESRGSDSVEVECLRWKNAGRDLVLRVFNPRNSKAWKHYQQHFIIGAVFSMDKTSLPDFKDRVDRTIIILAKDITRRSDRENTENDNPPNGSGKTYTMQPLPLKASQDIFRLMHYNDLNQGYQLFVSFFEIYGGKLFDLLNDRKKLCMREDGKQQESKPARLVGKLSFIDLAESERGADTTDNDKQTRILRTYSNISNRFGWPKKSEIEPTESFTFERVPKGQVESSSTSQTRNSTQTNAKNMTTSEAIKTNSDEGVDAILKEENVFIAKLVI